MATAPRADNYCSLDSDRRLPYHTSVFSSGWVDAVQVPSLVAPASPEDEGQISPCSFAEDPMLGYPWQQLPPSPSSYIYSPTTDDEEYVPHHIKLKPESLYPSPLLPPSLGIVSTQDILDLDAPLLDSFLVKDPFPPQPPQPTPLQPKAETYQDDHTHSDVDWCFSEDDDDDEDTYGDVVAAWPATLSHTNSFSTENNDYTDDEDDDDDDNNTEQHPLNRLLADLRDQIGKPMKDHDFAHLHQHVKDILDGDDGEFPEIRQCILDCVTLLQSHLDEDEDDDEELLQQQRRRQRRRSMHCQNADALTSDDDDDSDEEEDVWTPEEEEEDVSMSASYERRPRRSSSHSNGSSLASSSSSYRALSKKTRKNYSRETTRVLMNWYLMHGGKTPEPEHKDILAKQASKSHVQISTWFQNARRRHHSKLMQFQKLQRDFPDEVYDYDSFVMFTERTDRRKRAAAHDTEDEDDDDDEAGSSPSPKRFRK